MLSLGGFFYLYFLCAAYMVFYRHGLGLRWRYPSIRVWLFLYATVLLPLYLAGSDRTSIVFDFSCLGFGPLIYSLVFAFAPLKKPNWVRGYCLGDAIYLSVLGCMLSLILEVVAEISGGFSEIELGRMLAGVTINLLLPFAEWCLFITLMEFSFSEKDVFKAPRGLAEGLRNLLTFDVLTYKGSGGNSKS